MDQMRDNKFEDSGQVTASDLLERLGRFDENPSLFLVNLLAAQCFLGKADSGAILCSNGERRVDVLVVYPQLKRGDTTPKWLTESAELVQKHTEKTSVVKPLEQSLDQEQAVRNYVVLIPLTMAAINNATAVFHIETDDKAVLEEKFQKLQLITGMLNYSEARFARLVGQERLLRV